MQMDTQQERGLIHGHINPAFTDACPVGQGAACQAELGSIPVLQISCAAHERQELCPSKPQQLATVPITVPA